MDIISIIAVIMLVIMLVAPFIGLIPPLDDDDDDPFINN